MTEESSFQTTWSTDAPPSVTIVTTIADAEGVEPTALPPLYDRIDPESLDAVLRRASAVSSAVTITFEYHGYEVTVEGTGSIEIRSAAVEPTGAAGIGSTSDADALAEGESHEE